MKTYYFTLILSGFLIAGCETQSETVALKTVLKEKFYIGTALSVAQFTGIDTLSERVVKEHFSAIVPENCMKSMFLQPVEGEFFFDEADKFVAWGEANSMWITGHCLVWHSQAPLWLCVDEKGENVSPEILKERLQNHIATVVARYKGRIKGWDVVNEAILEDGSYRKSAFYEILGEEFIPLAFQYAHEADPETELYYNDYNMNYPGKRASVVKLINTLKERGIRIDAVGMQGHLGMDHPDIREFEESLLAFAATGVKVMITEWDMSALPTVQQGANVSDTTAYRQMLNPYPVSLPDSVSGAWNSRMSAFLRLFIKHAGVITRVTAWGVSDGDSWKNDWPVKGRRDYALLFDRNYQPKPFIKELLLPEQ
ncbi:MAG: endo-1,4-beta-xylanase [Tannerellaceae bacterium]|jgi:endo-1,4-beta-xylanase|nr:endo-1,4-beta-xylanase [Tannerellaceae bacterium]